MSGLGPDIRAVAGGIGNRIGYAIAQSRRTTPGPALVRLVAALAALGAMAVALPVDVLSSSTLSRTLVVLAPAALGVGLLPRSPWVSMVALFSVGGWLLATVGFGDPVSLARVGLLAGGLYVMHSAAAMAAVLPYDCVMEAGVLLRWVGRLGGVLAAGLALGLGGMALAEQLPEARTLAGAIVGAVIAAGLAALLAWHGRRPPP